MSSIVSALKFSQVNLLDLYENKSESFYVKFDEVYGCCHRLLADDLYEKLSKHPISFNFSPEQGKEFADYVLANFNLTAVNGSMARKCLKNTKVAHEHSCLCDIDKKLCPASVHISVEDEDSRKLADLKAKHEAEIKAVIEEQKAKREYQKIRLVSPDMTREQANSVMKILAESLPGCVFSMIKVGVS